MYLIKANGNYNIIIADIGVTISSSSPKGVLVNDELFEGSSHAKNLLAKGLIIAEKVKDKAEEVIVKPEPTKEEVKKESGAFVVEKEKVTMKPEDVFVAEAPKEVEAKKEVKTEVKETKVEPKIETKEEVVVTITESKVEKTEDTKEVKAEAQKAEVKETPVKKTTTRRKTTNNSVKK